MVTINEELRRMEGWCHEKMRTAVAKEVLGRRIIPLSVV
jgi:hypothetical protein